MRVCGDLRVWMGPLFPTIFGLSLERLDPADIEVGMCTAWAPHVYRCAPLVHFVCTACACTSHVHVHRMCTARALHIYRKVWSAGLVMTVVGTLTLALTLTLTLTLTLSLTRWGQPAW